MGKINDLLIQLQDAIIQSDDSYETIAAEYDVPLEWVIEAGRQIDIKEDWALIEAEANYNR